jgi:beta-glucosidase
LYKFPKDSKLNDQEFIFGVATASYQIEGATNVDDRCPSIWDTFCAKPGAVYKQHNGDVACLHYHLYQQDVNLIANLGMDAYRLSIAWPRIIKPDGSINQKGLDFYDRVISALEEKNLTIMVTLYHWDLPQYLDDDGGWLNRETAYKFAEYAEVFSAYFGDRIDFYATLNEPWCSAFHGYRDGKHAPGIADDRSAFQACHNLLLAHGLAMPILRKNAPNSKHGIVFNFTPNYPANDSAKDVTSFADDEHTHWFIKPIMDGEYPKTVYQHYIDVMPVIGDDDMGIISTGIDFLGVNYYTRSVIDRDGPYPNYKQVNLSDVERTHIGWEVYQDGLLKLLTDLNQAYKLPPVYITENGAAADDHLVDGAIDDEQRYRYYQKHLSSVDKAIRKGVDVRGYFAWSFMDNFEWSEGYKMRFGIVYVDYKTQKRIPKRSALMFKEFLNSRQ